MTDQQLVVWMHGICVGMYAGWIIGAFTAIVCLRPRRPQAAVQPISNDSSGA